MRNAQIQRAIVSIRTRLAAHCHLRRMFMNTEGDGVLAFVKAYDAACQRFNAEKPDSLPLFSQDMRSFYGEFEADWEDRLDNWIETYQACLDALENRPNRSEIDRAWADDSHEVDLIDLFL